jgi:excisionase family DNA binding protein
MNRLDALGTADDFTTLEVARLLGMSVRSVQLMVDRGELEAWKTSGGHRRIARASVDGATRATSSIRHPRSSGVAVQGSRAACRHVP